jgi:hypothetical protein
MPKRDFISAFRQEVFSEPQYFIDSSSPMPKQSKYSKVLKSKLYVKQKLPRVSPTVKSYVQKAINSNLEKKKIVTNGINQNMTTVTAATPSSILLIPDIAQGTADNQRIGNEVKVSKAMVRGYVNLLPYNIATNPQSSPCWVKFWLCSSKKINTNTLASTSVATDFFDTGGAVGTFTGNMRDMVLPTNDESWTVITTKTVKLGTTNGNTGGNPVSNATWYDNSQMSIPFEFEYGNVLKKLRYNDATAACTNKNLFLVMQPVYADGTNTAITAVEYHYTVVFDYTDA